MREKEEILNEAMKASPGPGSYDRIGTIHERLTIEVLIDIRDILSVDLEARKALKKALGIIKGGDHPDTH